MAYRVAIICDDPDRRVSLTRGMTERFINALPDDTPVEVDFNPPDVMAVDDCLLPLYNAIVVVDAWDRLATDTALLDALHEAARQDRLVKALHGTRLLDLFVEVAPPPKAGEPPVVALRPRPPRIIL